MFDISKNILFKMFLLNVLLSNENPQKNKKKIRKLFLATAKEEMKYEDENVNCPHKGRLH